MKSARLPLVRAQLPRRGHVIASVTLVDEHGFTHHYAPVETPAGTAKDAVALIHLHSASLAPADSRHQGAS